MERYFNWKVALLIGLALLSFGELYYVRANAPEAVKATCAHEPVDLLYKYQYSDCLRRNM